MEVEVEVEVEVEGWVLVLATDRAYRGSCRGPGWVPGPEQAAG